MNAKEIYELGKKNPTKELFNELLEKDKTGEWIYKAGVFWHKFDYEKGFDELVKKDKIGKWTYWAGADWSKFNYEKGFNELIRKDKTGELIYFAGKNWPKFDFIKALKILKNKFPKYYKLALKNWPKGKKELNYLNKSLKNSKTIKPKKFNIKEEILSLI